MSPKTKFLNYSVRQKLLRSWKSWRQSLCRGSSTPLSLQFSLAHSSFRSLAFPLARLRPDTLAHIHRHMRVQIACTCAHITRRAAEGNIRALYAGKYRSRKLCIGIAWDFMDFVRGKQVAFERIARRLRGHKDRERMNAGPSA